MSTPRAIGGILEKDRAADACATFAAVLRAPPTAFWRAGSGMGAERGRKPPAGSPHTSWHMGRGSRRRPVDGRFHGQRGGAGGPRPRASEGSKTSRGDIIIGRPALSLKALPSTHDTISHSYGLHNGETLPVAQRQTSISNLSFFAPASKALTACRVKAHGRMASHAETRSLTSPG
jgi:hypothetical protein